FWLSSLPLPYPSRILIETHVLKDYRSRVLVSDDFLRFGLDAANHDAESLLKAVREADEETIKNGRAYDATRKYPLEFELTDTARPYKLKAVESYVESSEVSGA